MLLAVFAKDMCHENASISTISEATICCLLVCHSSSSVVSLPYPLMPVSSPSSDGLHIFTTLPIPLLEHILSVAPICLKDLFSLRQAAISSHNHYLLHAIDAVAKSLMHAHPHACRLAKHATTPDAVFSALRFAERVDGAAIPVADTQIWSCGRNHAGEGARTTRDDINTLAPTVRVTSDFFDYQYPPATLISVAAGEFHSACLSALGVLHVTGDNCRGQLGLGVSDHRDTWTPVLDLRPFHIAQVACGASHTVVLTGDGLVFTTGDNTYGQLGLCDFNHRDCFQPVNLPPVQMIAAGNTHTVALLENGTVVAAGNNSAGQLASRHLAPSHLFVPIQSFGYRVVRVACGSNTTMLLTADNMVLVTGKRRSCLSVIGGLGKSCITHLSVGEGFAIARTDANEVAVSFHRKRFLVTDELEPISASCVSAGISHYNILTNNGQALAAGSNAFGQVAAGDMGLNMEGSPNARFFRPHRVPLSPIQIPHGYRALHVAAGAFHTLYLLAKIPS